MKSSASAKVDRVSPDYTKRQLVKAIKGDTVLLTTGEKSKNHHNFFSAVVVHDPTGKTIGVYSNEWSGTGYEPYYGSIDIECEKPE